jgi:O-antigen/teichoic acid export membrane protein
LNSLVGYVAYNTDKVLLGRFWGAETLGNYGRAYRRINLPTDNVNSTFTPKYFGRFVFGRSRGRRKKKSAECREA